MTAPKDAVLSAEEPKWLRVMREWLRVMRETVAAGRPLRVGSVGHMYEMAINAYEGQANTITSLQSTIAELTAERDAALAEVQTWKDVWQERVDCDAVLQAERDAAVKNQRTAGASPAYTVEKQMGYGPFGDDYPEQAPPAPPQPNDSPLPENLQTDSCPPRRRDAPGLEGEINICSLPSVGPIPEEIAEIEATHKDLAGRLGYQDIDLDPQYWFDATGTLLRALRSTGLVDVRNLAAWFAVHDLSECSSMEAAETLVASGIIQAAPTEEDIAEVLRSCAQDYYQTQKDTARAIQALWRKG